MIIRYAKEEDAKELLDIYAYYVTNTAITFEYEVPSHAPIEEYVADGVVFAAAAAATALRQRGMATSRCKSARLRASGRRPVHPGLPVLASRY